MKSYRILEIFGILIVALLFILIVVNYNPPIKNSVEDRAVEKLEDYPYLMQYFPSKEKDYASRYTYLNYSEFEKDFKELDIKELDDESASGIVVLNYHGTIADNPTTEYSISIETFKDHMLALKQEGYNTVTLDELYKFLRGEKELPKKSFVLTFDDGIRSTYYNVDPILKTLNYTAVMFVIAGYSLEGDSQYYLNKKELEKMQESGRWEIESHSYKGHEREQIDAAGNIGPFYSNKLWLQNESRLETDEEYAARTLGDLKKSKEVIEESFNKTVVGFALPFGDFGQWESNYYGAAQILIDETKQFYKMVFYQFKPATNKDFRANYNNKKDDFYLVMRISADAIDSSEKLLEEMEAASSLDLPYTEKFDNKKRWISLWGASGIVNNVIVLNGSNDTGAMSYLDGSYLWEDYDYSVQAREAGAQKLILLARFQDSENYVSCKYTYKTVTIHATKQGAKSTLGEKKLDVPLPGLAGASLKVSVKDNLVTCYLNDEEIVSSEVSEIPQNGGIGLRVEEVQNNKSTIFDSIVVNPV